MPVFVPWYKRHPALGRKHPRFVAGYPTKTRTGIIRKKRGAIKRALLRQPRPRLSPKRPYGVATRQIKRWSLEARAAPYTIRAAGSLEERIFYQALVDFGFIPGVDFDFQTSMFGGRAELGGLVADFMFPLIKLIVNPYSDWHTMSAYNIRRDLDQTAILESLGYTVLSLWPETIYDQSLLEEWIARNIQHMWGTSQNNGTSGFGGRDEAYDFLIAGDQILPRIEATLDSIISIIGV